MAIATMALMITMSGEEGSVSSARSAQVAKVIARLAVPGYTEMSASQRQRVIDRLQTPVRKAGHMAEYALLGCWLCVFARSFAVRGVRGFFLPLIGAAVFAASDEVHQLFVDARGPSIKDVGIDCAGAALGIIFALCVLGILSNWLKRRGM